MLYYIEWGKYICHVVDKKYRELSETNYIAAFIINKKYTVTVKTIRRPKLLWVTN